MRIRFLERTVYDTDGPGQGPVYEKDSVHDVSPDQAERWFRRGKAVEAAPEPPAAPEPAPKPAPRPGALRQGNVAQARTPTAAPEAPSADTVPAA